MGVLAVGLNKQMDMKGLLLVSFELEHIEAKDGGSIWLRYRVSCDGDR